MMQKGLAICLIIGGLTGTPVVADIAAGKTALDAGEFKVAINHLKPDLSGEDQFEANLYTGQAYASVGDFKASLPFLEAAVDLKPNHADAHYWWGAANGEMAGRASVFSAPGYATKSKAAFERAIELNPNHVDARAGLVEYLLAAPGFLGGDKDRALSEANKIKAFDKARGLSALANVHIAMEDLEAALDVFDEAITEFPQYMEPRLGRGMLLREVGQYETALSDFDALIALEPEQQEDVQEAVLLRGLAQYFFGATASKSGQREQEGILQLENYLAAKAYDIPLREGFGQYYLATLYLRQGNKEKAKELALAARKHEDNKDLKKLLKKLRKQLKRN